MPNRNQFSLEGRRALVTGSSRGIGWAIARAYAEAGAEVVLNSRDPDALRQAAGQLHEQGCKVSAIAFDVANADSVEEAIHYCESELGPIDILVNNAGQQHRAPLEDYPADRFERLLQANTASVFLVSQAVAKRMIQRRSGRIINICSIMSGLARPTIAPYAASKAAVANLTRGMAADWAHFGLNVNGIAPGFVKTDMNSALREEDGFSQWVSHRTPMGRWAEPEDLTGAAIFLASDASSFVNGHILYVDGGLTATI